MHANAVLDQVKEKLLLLGMFNKRSSEGQEYLRHRNYSSHGTKLMYMFNAGADTHCTSQQQLLTNMGFAQALKLSLPTCLLVFLASNNSRTCIWAHRNISYKLQAAQHGHNQAIISRASAKMQC